MTFIQPKNNSAFFNLLLGGLIVLVLSAVMALIMVYNDTVGLARAADAVASGRKALETENSELKRAVFASFDPVAMAAFAASRGMVTDRQPQYISFAH